jgi:lysozyme
LVRFAQLGQEVKLSKTGVDLMHRFEGCRDRPYLCPADIWTIGYGHVLYPEQVRLPMTPRIDNHWIRKDHPLKPEHNRVWTKDEINKLFAADVAAFERGVLRLVPGVAGRQGAFDAMVSFAYNVGLGNLQRSTARIKANRLDWDGTKAGLMLWTKAGGRVLPGLVRRRAAECALI